MPGIHNQHWQLPPLELLLAFEAAARHLSFTKAAGELFLTQSAISRQIQVLGQLDAATQKLRGAAAARTVTVTTTPGFASLWLIPRLNAYLQANPGVD